MKGRSTNQNSTLGTKVTAKKPAKKKGCCWFVNCLKVQIIIVKRSFRWDYFLIFSKNDKVNIFQKGQKADYYLSHKYDSILEASLISLFCISVVIKVWGIFRDVVTLEDAQSKQQNTTDEKHKESKRFFCHNFVTIQLLDDESDHHQPDESQLKQIRLCATIRIWPVESKLKNHHQINIR